MKENQNKGQAEKAGRGATGRAKSEVRSLLAAGVVAVAVLLIVAVFPFSEVLELKSRDLRATVSGGAEATAPVVIVTIDDISFDQINIRWPWPRELLAEAILALSDAGARVIGLDIMMGDSGYTTVEDEALEAAIAQAGNVILPAKFDRRVQGEIQIDYFDVPLAGFSDGARGIGFINFLSDRDGYVRRIVPVDTTTGVNRYLFALEILGAFAGTGVTGGNDEIVAGSLALPKTADGTLVINYAPAGSFRTVPFHQVLDGTVDPALFRDAIVLIGAYFKESHDLFLTPVESVSGLYGVEIHANILNTIYGGSYLKDTGRGVDLAALVVLVIAGALVLVRLKPTIGLLVAALSVAVYAVASQLAYSAGLILDVFDPILAIVLLWVGAVLYRYLVVENQRQKVRSTFSRFVSREVVDSILDSGRAIELGGETREVVIFFSDICGFTPLSASMSPADVVEMLNGYFTEMTEIIFRYEGTVNKYIGDAIMAFYGAPVILENPSERAVRACLEMRESLELFNRERELHGKPAIAIGMGLHKGRVLVGNIGSPRQMEYTVIGDAVNVSSRIEGLTRSLNSDLLISEDVYQDVKELVTVETFSPVSVKGKTDKIVVHSVTGLRGTQDV
jgi:adenylate cyclase